VWGGVAEPLGFQNGAAEDFYSLAEPAPSVVRVYTGAGSADALSLLNALGVSAVFVTFLASHQMRHVVAEPLRFKYDSTLSGDTFLELLPGSFGYFIEATASAKRGRFPLARTDCVPVPVTAHDSMGPIGAEPPGLQ